MSQSLRRAALLALTALPAIAPASANAAGSASLRIAVPRHVRTARVFGIVVTGSFRSSQLGGTAFLVIAIQPTASACQATAQRENKVLNVNVYFHKVIAGSPFKVSQRFTASVTGPRRVCAYLYSKFITPSSRAKPIAAAGRAYSAG